MAIFVIALSVNPFSVWHLALIKPSRESFRLWWGLFLSLNESAVVWLILTKHCHENISSYKPSWDCSPLYCNCLLLKKQRKCQAVPKGYGEIEKKTLILCRKSFIQTVHSLLICIELLFHSLLTLTLLINLGEVRSLPF